VEPAGWRRSRALSNQAIRNQSVGQRVLHNSKHSVLFFDQQPDSPGGWAAAAERTGPALVARPDGGSATIGAIGHPARSPSSAGA